jgi:hypothetical protein
VDHRSRSDFKADEREKLFKTAGTPLPEGRQCLATEVMKRMNTVRSRVCIAVFKV